MTHILLFYIFTETWSPPIWLKQPFSRWVDFDVYHSPGNKCWTHAFILGIEVQTNNLNACTRNMKGILTLTSDLDLWPPAPPSVSDRSCAHLDLQQQRVPGQLCVRDAWLPQPPAWPPGLPWDHPCSRRQVQDCPWQQQGHERSGDRYLFCYHGYGTHTLTWTHSYLQELTYIYTHALSQKCTDVHKHKKSCIDTHTNLLFLIPYVQVCCWGRWGCVGHPWSTCASVSMSVSWRSSPRPCGETANPSHTRTHTHNNDLQCTHEDTHTRIHT